MRTYVCPDGQWDETAQTCAAPGWVDQPPSFFSGMTVDQAGLITAAILKALMIWFVFRRVIHWAEREV